jgi:hypothetical protein
MTTTSNTTTNPATDTIFSWNIDNLEIISNHDIHQDVVKSVHYTYTGTYENYTAQISGSVELDPPDASNYAPYQDLTQEQVIGWVHTKYDIGAFNKNIIEQIQAQIPKPPVIAIFSLPWAAPVVEVDGNTDVSEAAPLLCMQSEDGNTDVSEAVPLLCMQSEDGNTDVSEAAPLLCMQSEDGNTDVSEAAPLLCMQSEDGNADVSEAAPLLCMQSEDGNTDVSEAAPLLCMQSEDGNADVSP